MLGGSISPHRRSWTEAREWLCTAQQDTDALGEGGDAMSPPTAVMLGQALPGHTTPCTACTPSALHPSSQGDARSQAGFKGSACPCRPQDTAKWSGGFTPVIPREAKDVLSRVRLGHAAPGPASSPSLLHRALRKPRDRERELQLWIRGDWSLAAS